MNFRIQNQQQNPTRANVTRNFASFTSGDEKEFSYPNLQKDADSLKTNLLNNSPLDSLKEAIKRNDQKITYQSAVTKGEVLIQGTISYLASNGTKLIQEDLRKAFTENKINKVTKYELNATLNEANEFKGMNIRRFEYSQSPSGNPIITKEVIIQAWKKDSSSDFQWRIQEKEGNSGFTDIPIKDSKYLKYLNDANNALKSF